MRTSIEGFAQLILYGDTEVREDKWVRVLRTRPGRNWVAKDRMGALPETILWEKEGTYEFMRDAILEHAQKIGAPVNPAQHQMPKGMDPDDDPFGNPQNVPEHGKPQNRQAPSREPLSEEITPGEAEAFMDATVDPDTGEVHVPEDVPETILLEGTPRHDTQATQEPPAPDPLPGKQAPENIPDPGPQEASAPSSTQGTPQKPPPWAQDLWDEMKPYFYTNGKLKEFLTGKLQLIMGNDAEWSSAYLNSTEMNPVQIQIITRHSDNFRNTNKIVRQGEAL